MASKIVVMDYLNSVKAILLLMIIALQCSAGPRAKSFSARLLDNRVISLMPPYEDYYSGYHMDLFKSLIVPVPLSVFDKDFYGGYHIDLFKPPRAPEPFRIERLLYATGSNDCIDYLCFYDHVNIRSARLFSLSSTENGKIELPVQRLMLGFRSDPEGELHSYLEYLQGGLVGVNESEKSLKRLIYHGELPSFLSAYELSDDPEPGNLILEILPRWNKREVNYDFKINRILESRVIDTEGPYVFDGIEIFGGQSLQRLSNVIDRIYSNLLEHKRDRPAKAGFDLSRNKAYGVDYARTPSGQVVPSGFFRTKSVMFGLNTQKTTK